MFIFHGEKNAQKYNKNKTRIWIHFDLHFSQRVDRDPGQHWVEAWIRLVKKKEGGGTGEG